METMWTIWYSTDQFARQVIENTNLSVLESNGQLKTRILPASDGSSPKEFHAIPTHLKNILYLDCPDLIIECEGKPVLSLEISKEAGTGHNAFQRFSRLAAAVMNGVPAFYIYPEAIWIKREGSDGAWDVINPNVFKAMERAIDIHGIPILLFYFPSEFNGDRKAPPSSSKTSAKGLALDDHFIGQPHSSSDEMQKMFACIDLLIQQCEKDGPTAATGEIMKQRLFRNRIEWGRQEFHAKEGNSRIWSPVTATTIVDTRVLMKYLAKFTGKYVFPRDNLLESRDKTLIYNVNSKFRGDPYPGALAALDYLSCRNGKTFEDREMNLVMAWGQHPNGINIIDGDISIRGSEEHSVNNFVGSVQRTYNQANKVLLAHSYSMLNPADISRYMMQVRFGTTFTKVKEIRVYSHFCDAILFHDGVLWREG